jgi:hypothetical protein
VSVLTSFDLVAEFKNITELKKRLHLNPYEMIILENNAFKKILEILIHFDFVPKFEKEKLKMRPFYMPVKPSPYISELVRSLECYSDKIDSVDLNKFDRQVLLINVERAFSYAESLLKNQNNKSSTEQATDEPELLESTSSKETTVEPDLIKKKLCQMAHQTIIAFMTSKDYGESIQKGLDIGVYQSS